MSVLTPGHLCNHIFITCNLGFVIIKFFDIIITYCVSFAVKRCRGRGVTVLKKVLGSVACWTHQGALDKDLIPQYTSLVSREVV